MDDERVGIDCDTVLELLAEGATAVRHPSGLCVMLTLGNGPPALRLPCSLMDELVFKRVVVLGDDRVYRVLS